MNQVVVPHERHAKPIAIAIPTDDIAALYACGTSPERFQQCLLARLKDAGGPVSGMLNLKLDHGALFKVKTDPTKPQDAFEYIWLPEGMVYQIATEGGPVH